MPKRLFAVQMVAKHTIEAGVPLRVIKMKSISRIVRCYYSVFANEGLHFRSSFAKNQSK